MKITKLIDPKAFKKMNKMARRVAIAKDILMRLKKGNIGAAQKKYIINITKDDIKKGIRNLPGSCPIALALNKKFNCGDSFAGLNKIFVKHVGASTPVKAKNFMNEFDGEQPVRPFKFAIIFQSEP